MSNTARQLSEKVQFHNGETELVTLRFDSGKLTPGRYGDQYMFGLEDGRIMFVEPAVNAQIVELGARRGDTIGITKRSEKQGRSTVTNWDVEIVQAATDENEPPDWARQPEPARTPERMDGYKPYAARTEQRQAPAPVETRIERQPVREVSQAQAAASSPASERDQLLRCLIHAIDAARLASRYAADQGQPVQFGGEDIRALALSVFIGHQKAGRV